jgi:biopolymer transport protein ExbD
MRTTLSILLFALVFASCSRANSLIVLEIRTTDAGISYTINNQQRNTPAEVEAWLRLMVSEFGDADPVLIRPDERTSFKTVLDMLQRFKAAGVKRFEVFTDAEVRNGARFQHSLSGALDSVRSERVEAAPPPK